VRSHSNPFLLLPNFSSRRQGSNPTDFRSICKRALESVSGRKVRISIGFNSQLHVQRPKILIRIWLSTLRRKGDLLSWPPLLWIELLHANPSIRGAKNRSLRQLLGYERSARLRSSPTSDSTFKRLAHLPAPAGLSRLTRDAFGVLHSAHPIRLRS
jgi:hypothetical protein